MRGDIELMGVPPPLGKTLALPRDSKITGAGTGLIEGCNRRTFVFVICSLKRSVHW